jgi:hypothetical protein
MRAFFLATAVLMAAEPDARLLRLLTEDTQMVSAIDWARYTDSRVASRFPVSLREFLGRDAQSAKPAQIVFIGSPDAPSLVVLFGEFSPVSAPEGDEPARLVSPEPGVLFAGESPAIIAALVAWRGAVTDPPVWASRLRDLGRDYDNWAFIRNPLPSLGKGIAPAPRPRWDELRKSLESVSLGVRFGPRIECFATATMTGFEDAAAAAALARWLPALAEMRGDFESDLVPLLENFEARQNGNRVEVRFSMANDKIPQLGIRVD